MKLWFTAAEFAALAEAGAMPGLPASKRGMNALIDREGWASRPGLARPRPGKGGGDEFHLDNLPLSTRLAWAARHFSVTADDLRPAVTEGDGLTGRARAERDARLVILRLADRFRVDQALSIAAADALFAGLFNAGSIDLPAWIREHVARVSPRSLARWRSAREAGADALAVDRGSARKGTSQLDRALDGAVRTYALAAIAKMPKLDTGTLKEALEAEFPGIAIPPLRTLQRQLAVWRQEYKNELMLLTDPDGYRSKVEFAAVGATRAERLNQLWQIDASPADIMLTEGRHSIYLAIDAAPRRIKVLVTPTPRAAAVGLLIRKCILAWGVPEVIKTDNGSDFVARSTERLLAALGIAVELSRPYEPRAKGMVERAIGTFQRDLSGLPGFLGHNVADQSRLRNRKAFAARLGADEAELFGVDMSAAEFQAWCDDWSDRIYGSTPHSALGGRSPLQAAAGLPGKVRQVDARALDVLLAPVAGGDGMRTVTKTGVRVGGSHYLTSAAMPGDIVFCRMDPADLGRLWLFAPDGETYLGEAVCPALAGLDPVETIARVRAEQKAYVDGRVKDIRKAMRKIGPRDVADAMRAAASERIGNVVAFPRPGKAHETPALTAAAAAVTPRQPQPLTGRAAEIHQEMQREAPPSGLPAISPARGEIGSSGVARLPDSREQRFRRALALEERRAAGEPVSADDLMWLGGYQAGSEYRAMRVMFDEFGTGAIGL
jgi:transposase InsO family protein